MTYHYSSTPGSPTTTTTTSTTSGSATSTPTTPTSTTAMLRRVAPAGYHYMPDGTLMSDAEHDRLYGGKSVIAGKKDWNIILAKDIHIVETEYKIRLNRNPVKPFTYGDLKNVAKDPITPDLLTIFTMNCVVEEIPIPKVNRVLGLSTIPRELISKYEITTYPTDDGEEIEYPTNYMMKSGGNIAFTVTGDIGASYDLIVKDITNTKWYDWENNEFTNGYTSKQGVVDYVSINLRIPPQTQETKYQIFLKPIGSTDYSEELPTEINPWYICQLMDAVTTFKFDNRIAGFISETTVLKTYAPGAIINSNENGFKTDITITVLPKRGKIKLLNEDILRAKVNSKLFSSPSSSGDRTSVLDVDLVATVDSDYSTGAISGTITIHKSAIRDYEFSINPTNFFTII